MSMFVHVENQKLLWDIITNTELYKVSFEKSSQLYRDNWFKSIIQEFYKENYLRNLSTNALNNLNRDVIAYMVQKMKIMVESAKPMNVIRETTPSNIGSVNQPITPQIEPVSAYSRNQPQSVENKQEVYNRQFSERQKAYESMSMKPLPPVDVKFGENVKDEAISNMDELIKQHTRQREEELRQYAPLLSSQVTLPSSQVPLPSSQVPLPSSQVPLPSSQNLLSNPSPLLISKENIRLLPDNVLPEDNDSKMKKNVSWSENLENNEIFKTQQKDIEILKSQVLELTKIISVMKDEFDKMKEYNICNGVSSVVKPDDTVFSIIEGIIGTIEDNNTDLVK